MSDGVLEMFKSIIANRKPQNNEQVVEGYSGFLYLDKAGLPLVAMHWQHRMNHMVKRYNEIYIRSRCQTSHRMYAGIHIAATWPNRE